MLSTTVRDPELIQAEMTPVSIVQGEDRVIEIRISDENERLDLTNYEIETCLMNTDGTDLTLDVDGGGVVVVSAVLGKINVVLTAAQTALLKLVNSATLELTLTDGDELIRKVQVLRAYSVIESAC